MEPKKIDTVEDMDALMNEMGVAPAVEWSPVWKAFFFLVGVVAGIGILQGI